MLARETKPWIHLGQLLVAVILMSTAGAQPTLGQNLITDGSFEDGLVPHCQQAAVPDTWYMASITPDVYSSDCSLLEGLGFIAFGNFTTITNAQDGLRFVAGGTAVGAEAFGQPLATPLSADQRYRISAYVSLSNRLPQPGVFDIYLSTSTSKDDGVVVASVGATASVGSWTLDSAEFCAPDDAGDRPYIIMWPRSTGASSAFYAGTDDWSLEFVSMCGPVQTKRMSWGAQKARF